MNQAVQNNPLATRGSGMVDDMSQAAGGLMGGLTGSDPESFMNEGAKEKQARETARRTDEEAKNITKDAFTADDPQTMETAAQRLDALGKYQEAARLRERAAAINTKNAAILDAGMAGIQEEATRKKEASIRTQALSMARRRGDKAAIAAITSGAVDGAQYLETVSKEKPGFNTVSEGSIAVQDDGTVIAKNPKQGVPGLEYKLTGPDKVQMNKSQEAWQAHSQRATQAQSVADQINSMAASSMKAGAYATASEYINGVTGTRDKASQLRTQYLNIQKSGIVQAMPSGPQSDNDVRIFSRGFPPENAGKEEIVEFLEAQSSVADKAANYEEMRINYIASGKQADFIPDWKRRMEKEGRLEYIEFTPPSAVAYLALHPEGRDEFLLKYGWTPTAQELEAAAPAQGPQGMPPQ